jgi:C4-dicarboxylate transporter DctM subunit
MLITVPVFLPIFVTMGLDPIWFGVFIVVVAEIGLITPPVGLNIFVIKSQLPDIPIGKIYAGIIPFLFVDLSLIVFLVIFPGLATWLPRVLLG